MCGEVLVGTHGRAQISKSYLEIAGFVRDWVAEPGSTWRNQTYISPPDKRQMAFCTEDGANCLFDYVEMKREAQRVRHEAKLREEASVDWGIRNAPPSGGTGGGSGYVRRGSPPPAPFNG